MKPLKCPKCKGKLESIVYETIEVDRCCQCQGIWFDQTEAESLKKKQGSEKIDLGNPNSPSNQDRVNPTLKCPRCRTTLIKMLDLDKYQIWYEKCPNCQGIWLDAGEFSQFKQNFATQEFRFPWQKHNNS